MTISSMKIVSKHRTDYDLLPFFIRQSSYLGEYEAVDFLLVENRGKIHRIFAPRHIALEKNPSNKFMK
jgi:hypothetical protein